MRAWFLVAAALAAAIVVAAVVACGGSDGEADAGTPTAQPTRPPPAPSATRLDRARELIRECRVGSVVSLHDGSFFLDLKDGSRFDLPPRSDRAVYAELRRATGRCGSVPIAME